MSQIYTILFDLDGTIVDTAPDLMAAHNYVMKKFGHQEKKLSEIKSLAGKGSWVMMQRSFKEDQKKIKDESLKKEMTKEFINYYSKNIDKNSKPINGIIDFLKWAKSKNISSAVCTNKQEKLAIDLLKKIKLFDYFEYVAGSDTFEFNKPDPRHLTNVVEIIGGDLNKTIMVGDSEVDAMSADNAKLPFVLVENGYTEKTTKEIKHNVLIKNFIDFEKIIEKYL
jgi:phosphoglycolate phosphatase